MTLRPAPSRPTRSTASLLPVTVLVVTLLGALLAACDDGSDDDAGGRAASTPGPTTSVAADGSTCGAREQDGVQVRTFCGTGTVKVTSGDTALTLDGAACDTSSDYLAVNAGTVALGSAGADVRSSTRYVGLTVGRVPGDTQAEPAIADGTVTGGLLTANDRGTALVSEDGTLSATLTGGRTAGTFTATTADGDELSGTFSCS